MSVYTELTNKKKEYKNLHEVFKRIRRFFKSMQKPKVDLSKDPANQARVLKKVKAEHEAAATPPESPLTTPRGDAKQVARDAKKAAAAQRDADIAKSDWTEYEGSPLSEDEAEEDPWIEGESMEDRIKRIRAEVDKKEILESRKSPLSKNLPTG